MRALVPALGALALVLHACTEQIELFPAPSPPSVAICDASTAADDCGCVATVDASGVQVPCVCKRPCNIDSDCPTVPTPTPTSSTCDVSTGLCTGHELACKTRADCPRSSASGVASGWLCISAK